MDNKNFRENIKVNNDILEAVENVSKIYKEQCRELEQEDKERLIRYLKYIEREIENDR